jgi:hypothetical protein
MSGTITIEERFHGPRHSGNGGYVCGRLAAWIEGTARVRLYVPPPLEVPLRVRKSEESVVLEYEGTRIAEAWPAEIDIAPPSPPSLAEATSASRRFRGFHTHRFASCFVCGPDRAPGEGLRIFAGQVQDRDMVACRWTPTPDLAQPDLGRNDGNVSPEYVWCVLDCPGGFAFPEPESGTILLGELTVARLAPVRPGEPAIVVGWEISREGRKHHTGTALFSAPGRCLALGRGTWFEVEKERVEAN